MKRLPALAVLPLLALLASACHRDSVATPEPQPSPASAPASNPSPAPMPETTPEPTASTATTVDQRIVLAAGQSAAIAPGASLAFVRLVNDSRCPANVQCVWAGEVTLALALTAAGWKKRHPMKPARWPIRPRRKRKPSSTG